MSSFRCFLSSICHSLNSDCSCLEVVVPHLAACLWILSKGLMSICVDKIHCVNYQFFLYANILSWTLH